MRALPVINANGTVKETPIFLGGGGDTKDYVGSSITNIVGLCVCAKFRVNRSLARLVTFSRNLVGPVEAFNNGMPYGKSTNKW